MPGLPSPKMFDSLRYRDRLSSSETSRELPDSERLLVKEGHFDDIPLSTQQRPASAIVKGLILVATHCFFLVVGLWTAQAYFKPDLATCTEYTEHASPVINAVPTTYHEVTYNGSFSHLNAFRGNAGPEVDAAWESLGIDYRALTVPESEAEAAGIQKNQVRINQKYGGGYPANIEGLHHLHCLNLLRKSLVWNYDYYKNEGKMAFSNEEHIVKLHVTHCLDIVRQQLMCQIDTGVLGQVWWNKEEPSAFVDFNTKHVCKNFEEIRRFAELRQLPVDVPEDYLVPPRLEDVFDEIP